MVFQLRLWIRTGSKALIFACIGAAFSAGARAEAPEIADARSLYRAGDYFSAARYAFSAQQSDPRSEGIANAWIALSLMRSGLHNAASYFFIKTLQSGDKDAIRLVLGQTQELLVHVGGDILRKYLIRHTAYEDYDPVNRSAYLYSLGKQALLGGQEEKAVGYFSGMSKASPLWPFALQLRASAQAILGKSESALQDFTECVAQAPTYESSGDTSGDGRRSELQRMLRRESEDLVARCQAGYARVLYQQEKFNEADRAYDAIPKESFVWPDILFEQAWNGFARQEYNRTLGKLVSYKSPALSFVHNSEIDVLRAQAYLALCLYADANAVINEFNAKYSKVGESIKRFVEANSANLGAFYEFGKRALKDSLYTRNDEHRMANRFVRGPYFQNLVASEKALSRELGEIRRMSGGARSGGFSGFLELVLGWRLKTIRALGGAFVKNSLLDYHTHLIADFEKIAFIKLEMLSRAKDKILYQRASGPAGRDRGSVEPTRRDDQYFWSFNGEFWNDELGDYVFGLESECGK